MTNPWHPNSKDVKIDTLIALTAKLVGRRDIKGGGDRGIKGKGTKGTGKGAKGGKGESRGKGPHKPTLL